MANETNLHRAARRLQRAEGIPYQVARQRILDERAGRTPTPPSTPPRATGPLFSVGDRLESLAPESIAGSGTVVEVAVNGNEHLIRVETDAGSSVVLDARRFTGSVDHVDAAALIAAARTETSNLEGLVALSSKVVAVADPDGGEWVLHCIAADGAHVAYVDPSVDAEHLEGWLTDRGVAVEVVMPDGSLDPVDCVATGSHLMSCDDDGYCNFCGHDSLDELAAHTPLAAGRCLVCRVPSHDTCAMVDDCTCCADTAAVVASRS